MRLGEQEARRVLRELRARVARAAEPLDPPDVHGVIIEARVYSGLDVDVGVARAVQATGDPLLMRFYAARALRESGRTKDAMRMLLAVEDDAELAARDGPRNSPRRVVARAYWTLRGVLAAEHGDADAAAEAYQSARKAAPANRELRRLKKMLQKLAKK